MDRWCDKVAVVTGASSGIGEAIVRDLVTRGIKVAALARRVDRLKKLESELSGKGTIMSVPCDISVEEDIAKAFQCIDEKWGGIHIMINNAGYFTDISIADLEAAKLKKMFDTNVVGLTICMGHALKSMKAHGIDSGHIININSVAGHTMLMYPGIGGYTATKYGVTVLSEYARREMANKRNKIKITSISPGLVRTEMSQAVTAMAPDIPALEAEDIRDAVIYVLSTPPNVHISELKIQPLCEGGFRANTED